MADAWFADPDANAEDIHILPRDVYAIGAILHVMATGEIPEVDCHQGLVDYDALRLFEPDITEVSSFLHSCLTNHARSTVKELKSHDWVRPHVRGVEGQSTIGPL